VLWHTALNGPAEIVLLPLAKGGVVYASFVRNKRTLLSWAASSGQVEVVDTLLSQGANVEFGDEGGWGVALMGCPYRKGLGCPSAARGRCIRAYKGQLEADHSPILGCCRRRECGQPHYRPPDFGFSPDSTRRALGVAMRPCTLRPCINGKGVA
jgi:hypothetical protein